MKPYVNDDVVMSWALEVLANAADYRYEYLVDAVETVRECRAGMYGDAAYVPKHSVDVSV